ncbi:MAG: transglycosylase SLT domain-containing protein [Candidatus Woesearchaeota archaeon]
MLLLVSFASAEKILSIGSSHVTGDYGKELHRLLMQKGYTVESYGSCGAKAAWYVPFNPSSEWVSQCKPGTNYLKIDSNGVEYPSTNTKTPLIDYLINSFQPQITIVSLGTNYLSGSGVTNDKANIDSLLSYIKGTKCYWVGAPVSLASNVKPTEINQKLQEVIAGRCTFIDPTSFTNTDQLDGGGIHFTSAGGIAMAQGVFKAITGQAAAQPTAPTGINPQSTTASVPGTTITQPAYSSTKKTSIPGCKNFQTCSEIDEVWSGISSKLGIQVGRVYDPLMGGFVDFQSYYYEKKMTGTTTIDKTQFDAYIQQASQLLTQDAALMKAIIVHESSFKPNDISSTGCSGLMQICSGSSPPSIIKVQCSQDSGLGPRKCDVSTCRTGRLGSSNAIWCDVCTTSGTQCADDERFDIVKNIQAGVKVFVGKETVKKYCGVECQIAAYNIGGCVIEKAAAGKTGLTWDDVYKGITPEVMDQCSSTYRAKSLSFKQTKITGLKGYVSGIMADYNKYKGTI